MAESKARPKPINTRRRLSPAMVVEEEEEMVVEPLSPAARLFHTPKLNVCIIAEMGCKTKIDVDVVKDGFMHTLVKHPRFSSKMVFDPKRHGKPVGWVRTKVNIDDHIIVPDLDPNMDSPDQFVEDYVSNLTTIPMDFSKPLWEAHVLHVETSKAKAVTIFRIHHSVGDGISLISLLLACTRKSSDPKAVPSLPVDKKKNNKEPQTSNWFLNWFHCLLFVFKVFMNTWVDLIIFLATATCLKDTNTPLKEAPGTEGSAKRFVLRTLSLDDIKMIKNAMDVTVNDVVLGITQAGLSQYLNRRNAKTKGDNNFQEYTSCKSIRLRSTLLVNLRPSTMIQGLAKMMEEESSRRGWDCGNLIGYILIPFHIALRDDPLDHIRDAKATIDRKKQSLEARFTYASVKFIVNTLGFKVATNLTYNVLSNATLSFSNVVGPTEEISFYGHPVAYIAPSAYGNPQALTIHLLSYMDKMTLVVAVDPDVIPDPHKLCDDIEEALQLAKDAVIEK